MQAVILAAGAGTRMRPLTYDIPKPMLPIQGRPIMAYTFDSLPAAVDEVIIVVGYLGQQIKDYFGSSYQGRNVIYVQQEELLGTGQAVSLCKDLITGKFLVLMGDDIFAPADMQRALQFDRCVFAKSVLADQQRNYGLFDIDSSDHLLGIVETELEPGQTGLVYTGLTLLDKHFFDYDLVPIKGGKEFGLPQTIVTMAKEHPVKVLTTDSWLPVGYPEDLPKAEEFMKELGMLNSRKL